MLNIKTTYELQTSDSVAQLKDALAQGKQSGEEKGWLSCEHVKQQITERYYNKH